MPPEIFMGRKVIRVVPREILVLRLGYMDEGFQSWVDITLDTETGKFHCPQFPGGPWESLRVAIDIVGEFLDSREE